MSGIDPSKVKAGDTVTLERDTALARDIVERIDPYPQGGFSIVLAETTPAYLTVTGWTITQHEPAPTPEWEPGTAGTATVRRSENRSGGTERLRVMRVHPHPVGIAFAWVDDHSHHFTANEVTDFVPDDAEALGKAFDDLTERWKTQNADIKRLTWNLEAEQRGRNALAAGLEAERDKALAEVERLRVEVDRLRAARTREQIAKALFGTATGTASGATAGADAVLALFEQGDES